MFEKVLVAEDMDDINKGMVHSLKELGISEVQQVQYCDDAFLRLKRAVMDGRPFDLLITDLSFKVDYRDQKYASGEALAKAASREFPELKIIVYSVEDRLQKVRRLIQNGANAYVCKGRHGLRDLFEAIRKVYQNEVYLSNSVSPALGPKQDPDIEEFDLLLLENLSRGMTQEEISLHFKQKQLSPSSLSAIEKRLNRLKVQFRANNTIHLVAKVKDLGLV